MDLKRRTFLVAGSVGAAGWLVGCSAPGGLERLGDPADFAGPGGEVALNAYREQMKNPEGLADA